MQVSKIVSIFCFTILLALPSLGSEIPNAPRNVRTTTDATFTAKPTITRKGDSTTIRFAVSAATDVEVAVLDADGKVVRHLAAGLLGPAAPAPLAKDSLSQTIVWDGKDDRGQNVDTASSVRVRLGVTAKLDRYLGWDGLTLSQEIIALAVNDHGDLYVVETEKSWGRSTVRVLSKEGKYLRTVMPFPADTPAERRKEFGTNTMPDGTEVPFVFNAQNGCTQPLTSALRNQDVVVHPDGHLVLTSADGSLSNHGPAQYLIAVHPEGGAPVKTGYVGPQVRDATGFAGGAGNRDENVYHGLASSPDGKYFYKTRDSDSWIYKKQRVMPQCVYRIEWNDEGLGEPFVGKLKAGDDDQHFTHPMGLATDAAGNLYVCDNGNDRVMVFSPDAKLLAKVALETPYQVCVHPKTGVIYVLSRKRGKPSRVGGSKLTKFSPIAQGVPKQVAQLDMGRKLYVTIALDHTSTPARLYAVEFGGWREGDVLKIVTDKGDTLELGGPINNRDGLAYPLTLSIDPHGNTAYVRNFMEGMDRIDLKTGKTEPANLGATEVVVSPTGDLYACQGWAWSIKRYTEDKKAKPLKEGDEKGAIGPWKLGTNAKGRELWARTKGFGQGGRGYTFGPDGNLYVIKMPQYTHGHVDVYSPEGKLIQEKLIDNLPYSSAGISVDAAGNIYLGVNLRAEEGNDFFPKGFEAVPTEGWTWYRRKRKAPWNDCYYNTYLFYYGHVIKFGPEGGKFHIWRVKKAYQQPTTERPAEAGGDLPVYRSGYLSEKIAVEGSAKWLFNGCSPLPTSGESWGDPSCSCWNIRLKADPYGRVFVPDAFRFAVNVLDTNGNLITRIGQYGNADDRDGAIYLNWPTSVDLAGDRLYITDARANRLTVVNLDYAAEAKVDL